MEEKDELDTSVGFLYKAMLERDPRKRRVKPVQHHMLQLDFAGVDDSSDDSDFELKGHKDSDATDEGSGDEESDPESGSDGSGNDSDGESGSEDDEEDKEEGEDQVEGEEGKGEEDARSEGISIKDDLSNMGGENQLEPTDYTAPSSVSSAKKFKVLVCCVCLGDRSEEIDEIVECDGCRVSVHEGCYGISESQSVASTESSASTEPWFCDACKAGVRPHCELCPNFGGIYKETDTGRWVHTVCALYVPGVAFGDVDKLGPVTLFEMPCSKWGAKECSLCEDERFSRTGVCVGCDAGMCRTHFHVTCAQREGLLSEAAPDEEIADPFYAYCKQHAEKSSARSKRRNFLAVQSNVKNKKEQESMDETEKMGLDENEQTYQKSMLRVQRKLNRHRQKYLAAKAKRPPSWVPTEKVPRLLHSSPSALRRLMRKAELLGINTQLPSNNKDIRKKWHVAPAFSTEFVSYYLDRNVRMRNMKTQQHELEVQQETKRKQERQLRFKYDKLSQDVQRLKESSLKLRHEGETMWAMLSDMAWEPIPLPEVLKPKKVPKTPSRREKDLPRSPPAIIHSCGLCSRTTDQHLLAKCDKCRLFYHLGCLDPPLSRMPKKTKQFGWQCSECASDSSDSEVGQVKTDPDAPRRLRDVSCIKEPSKYTPFIKEKLKKRTKKARGPVLAKKKIAMKRPREDSDDMDHTASSPVKMPELKKEKITPEPSSSSALKVPDKSPAEAPKSPKKKVSPRLPRQVIKKEADKRTECATCNKPGDNGSLVRCDECRLCYHFQCLDPPCKRSPKVRGYGWLCSACDPTESSQDEDEAMDVDQSTPYPKVMAASQDMPKATSSSHDTKKTPTKTPDKQERGKMAQVTVSLGQVRVKRETSDDIDSGAQMPELKQERTKTSLKGSRIEKISKVLSALKAGNVGKDIEGSDPKRCQTPPPPTLSPKQKLKCVEKRKHEDDEESAPELEKEST